MNELEGKVNYFIGNDPAKWRTDVPTFGRVRYAEVYPGMDVVYYGNQRQLGIRLRGRARTRRARRSSFSSRARTKSKWTRAGDLLLTLGETASIRQPKPVVYQEVAGARRAVEGGYAVGARRAGRLRVGEYDRSAAARHRPGAGLFHLPRRQRQRRGPRHRGGLLRQRLHLRRHHLDQLPHGQRLRRHVQHRQLAAARRLRHEAQRGGHGPRLLHLPRRQRQHREPQRRRRVYGIAVDSAGNAYVAGDTRSTNFPTANAVKATFGGGLSEAFVTKLNAAGNALVYSTYLGGDSFDSATSIAVDSSGNAYVTGRTTSTNFPTVNPIQATFAGGGSDAFMTKINAAGSALVYSTYLGGGGGNGFDTAFGIAVDSAGNAYVTGPTSSTNFPTANAIQATFGGGTDGDAFVTKINAAGTALVYSTYLGGSDNDIAQRHRGGFVRQRLRHGQHRFDQLPHGQRLQTAHSAAPRTPS